MEAPHPIVKRKEYSITVEDTTLHLMVDLANTQTNEAVDFDLISLHTHAYTELFVCVEGEITIATATDPIRLLAGDIAIVPPSLHHYRTITEAFGVYRAVGLSLVKRPARASQNLYRPLSSICLSDAVFVKRGCPELCRILCDLTGEPNEINPVLPAMDVFRLLLSLCTFDAASRYDMKFTPNGGEIKRIAQLEDIIETQYMNALPMEDLARMLYISPRQLSRIVKRRYDATLHDIILKKRVQVAADLLLHTDRTVEEIGGVVGFRSRSCYYAAFKEEYGVTPLAYRKGRKV